MPSAFDPSKDLPDLTGRVAIVTGSTSGIGVPTVQQLARKGAKVYLAARSEQKASATIAKLEAEGLAPGKGTLAWLSIDLADPESAKKAAEEFLRREERLDILINNAAITMTDFILGALGIQEIMVINYLSPVVFTEGLLPLMKKTAGLPGADVRIVNVSSEAHSFANPTQLKTKEDFNMPYKGERLAQMKRYGLSKLALNLYTKQLQSRLSADGLDIICVAIHPGGVYTEGANKIAPGQWYEPLALLLIRLFFVAPQEGAKTSLLAAAAPQVRTEAATYKGAYVVPVGKLKTPSKASLNPQLAQELWETTQRILKEGGIW